MYCLSCKKKLIETPLFCPHCGSSTNKKKPLSLTKKLLIGFVLLTCFLTFSSSFPEGLGLLIGYALIYFIYRCFKRAIRLKNEQGGWFKKSSHHVHFEDHLQSESAKQINDWKESLDELWHGSKEISFDYEDYSGNTTTRTIILKHLYIDVNGDFVFKGFCLLRQSHRTFKLDSIISNITCNGLQMDPLVFIEEELGIIVDAEDTVDEDAINKEVGEALLDRADEIELLESKGLLVNITFEPAGIELFKTFKNGKRHKTPSYKLFYNSENTVKRWSVLNGNKQESFNSANDAVAKFLDLTK